MTSGGFIEENCFWCGREDIRRRMLHNRGEDAYFCGWQCVDNFMKDQMGPDIAEHNEELRGKETSK